jgi:hypothetical protein
MAGNRLFQRRRDGRIEVRVNELGRSSLRGTFAEVLAAERDGEHEWHASLHSPINPSEDEDDPVSALSRQSEMATNAELAAMTADEQFLSGAEAWAWLSTLQVALRSTVVSHGLLTDEKLAEGDAELREYIAVLQQFLFALAECL